MANRHFERAKKEKNDEWYTPYNTIETEVEHYIPQLKDKIIYCNCDDYRWSNFVKYFKDNFNRLNIKELRATNYNIGDGAYYYQYDGETETITQLQGDGSFDSDECIEILNNSDIIITNPPFSIFRRYFDTIKEKQFLVMSSLNSLTYKNVFPYIKDNKVRVGWLFNKTVEFSNGKKINICWLTTLKTNKHNVLQLTKTYNETEYPKYQNYDAINVDKVSEIPMDYDGVMGVPITFLDKYCPEQFEIVGIACGNSWANYTEILKSLNFNPNIKYGGGLGSGVINGKGVYARILIRHKK